MTEEDTRYPRLFGKYALIAPLAKGGMGQLHLALAGEADLKKLCVIKQIIAHLADQEFISRFVDEAKVMVKLSHGNLVPVFESGANEGQYFLVMEFIEGKDLRAVWQRLHKADRTMPLDVSLHIIKEICRGLSYAHNHTNLQLVHRDVSPPNVLLSYSGEVKLTDFGLAQSTLKIQKTAPGVLFGKLAYMSPEQARNETVDPRTDVFATGVIFWELLTGKRFFTPGGTQMEQLKRAANPVFERPSKIKKDLPPAVDLIATRALAPQKEARYPNAEAMRQDIAGLLAKLAPTIDSASVARFLESVYGVTIAEERRERGRLLERMGPQIAKLRRNEALDTDVLESPPEGIETLQNKDADPAAENTTPLPDLSNGTLLGDRYRIDELIGAGGMGTVYSATHMGIDRKVAVKVLHPVYSNMPAVVQRFRHEARAASKIGHPNIIQIFDSGETEQGAIYFAMEHLAGQDLAEALSEEQRLSIDRTLRIGTQISEAVGAAHKAGIIHRDLKPENIFLVPQDGQLDFVKVLDFGIATNAHLEESRKERLTNPGMAMGTPEYMSPEQAAGKGCDHRADIYAVGAILYEMLTGRPPHQGKNLLEVLTAKATEPVIPLRELRIDVPDSLARIIEWTLETNPENRPQEMGHLTYELNKLQTGRVGAVASILGLEDLAPKTAPPEPQPPQFEVGSTEDLSIEIAPVERATPHKERRTEPTLPLHRRFSFWSALLTLSAAVVVVAVVLAKRPPDQKPVATTTPATKTTSSAIGPNKNGQPAKVLAPQKRVRPNDGAPTTQHAALPQNTPATRPARPTNKTKDRPPRRRDTAPRKPARRSSASAWRAGRRHLKAGQYGKARAAFVAVRGRYRARALLGLAEIEFQRKNYRAAVRFAKLAVRRGGGWRAKLAQANYLFKLRRLREAIGLYQAVLRQAPSSVEAKRNLEAALRRQRR
jgi:serine/threonine protein kinase